MRRVGLVSFESDAETRTRRFGDAFKGAARRHNLAAFHSGNNAFRGVHAFSQFHLRKPRVSARFNQGARHGELAG